MTRHIPLSDISLSEAQELHAALRIADNLQVHTHARALSSIADTLTTVCIQCAHRYTYLTHRGVCIFHNTAEPTIYEKKSSHTNTHTHSNKRTTHARQLAICPVHNAVASGDNTLHWTKTHHSLHTYLDKALCVCLYVCLLAFFSKSEWKS